MWSGVTMLVKPYDAARHTTGVTGGVATVTRQQASARGVYAVRMHHAAINAGAVVAYVCFICLGCIRVAYHSVRCCVICVCWSGMSVSCMSQESSGPLSDVRSNFSGNQC